MIRVLQFGEGNFLRAFAEPYFQALNERALSGDLYKVAAVKPRPGRLPDAFAAQKNKYHVILRGMENGKSVERVKKIDVLDKVISLPEKSSEFYSLARDESLKIILSNTTEEGIRFCENDRFGDLSASTYPAKLTVFLYERYLAGLDGVYIMPLELIDDNAAALERCVEKYILLWRLPEAFVRWNKEKNYYCETLVDRIVSGYPQAGERSRLQALTGGIDKLMCVGEPFGLWVVQNKGDLGKYLQEGKFDVRVVLTDDVDSYKKRKVRILNALHTNFVGVGLLSGKRTVYECMTDAGIEAFTAKMLREEILPFLPSADARHYAEDVLERFRNPYLQHRLESIALNSFSKWRARVLPTVRDYCARYEEPPECLTFGFACLIYLSRRGRLPGTEPMEKPLRAWMEDESFWGENLLHFTGFYERTKEQVARLEQEEYETSDR